MLLTEIPQAVCIIECKGHRTECMQICSRNIVQSGKETRLYLFQVPFPVCFGCRLRLTMDISDISAVRGSCGFRQQTIIRELKVSEKDFLGETINEYMVHMQFTDNTMVRRSGNL